MNPYARQSAYNVHWKRYQVYYWCGERVTIIQSIIHNLVGIDYIVDNGFIDKKCHDYRDLMDQYNHYSLGGNSPEQSWNANRIDDQSMVIQIK